MKKALLALAAVLVMAASFLVGCGSDSLANTTWEATTIEMGGQTYDVQKLAEAMDSDEGITFQFTEDKIIASFMGDEDKKEVAYTYENGKLTIEGESFEVKDGEFTVEWEGQKMHFKKK